MLAAGRIIRSSDTAGMAGRIVFRGRRITAQTIANNTVTFVSFSSGGIDLDVLSGWSAGQPTRYTPPLAGHYLVVCRAVFGTNSTSRRSAYAAKNAATSGDNGALAGTSVQAAGTGTTQCGGDGVVQLNGSTDFVGVRVLQNSGGNLDLTAEATDGGSTLEVFYVGPL